MVGSWEDLILMVAFQPSGGKGCGVPSVLDQWSFRVGCFCEAGRACNTGLGLRVWAFGKCQDREELNSPAKGLRFSQMLVGSFRIFEELTGIDR